MRWSLVRSAIEGTGALTGYKHSGHACHVLVDDDNDDDQRKMVQASLCGTKDHSLLPLSLSYGNIASTIPQQVLCAQHRKNEMRIHNQVRILQTTGNAIIFLGPIYIKRFAREFGCSHPVRIGLCMWVGALQRALQTRCTFTSYHDSRVDSSALPPRS